MNGINVIWKPQKHELLQLENMQNFAFFSIYCLCWVWLSNMATILNGNIYCKNNNYLMDLWL